jgi:hypothetical protein
MKIKGLIFLFAILFNLGLCAQTPDWAWGRAAQATQSGQGWSTVVDIAGNIYVAGFFDTPTITFGSFTFVNADTISGTRDVFVVKYNAAGAVLWARSFGGNASDEAFGIDTDANGYVVVTGRFTSPSMTIGATTLLNTNMASLFVAKISALGNVVWATSGDAGSACEAWSISIDGSSNIYISGDFVDTLMTFAGDTLWNADVTGWYNNDIFIAKLSPSGSHLWARGAGGDGVDCSFGVAADKNGMAYITGYYQGPIAYFDTDTVNTPYPTGMYIAKYSPSGNILWVGDYHGNDFNVGWGIATDTSGNVYASGWFTGDSLTFGTTLLSPMGAFLVKCDSSGNVLWAKSKGFIFNGVTVDENNNPVVTGYFTDSVLYFGNDTLYHQGNGDVFVGKYSSSGNELWAKTSGGTEPEEGRGVACGPGEIVYVTGSFHSPELIFDTDTLQHSLFVPPQFFLAKLGPEEVSTVYSDLYISENALRIFPNPFSSQTTLLTEKAMKNACLHIYNSYGQEVKEVKNISGQKINLQKDQLSDGVYFIVLTEANEVIASGKMVISK